MLKRRNIFISILIIIIMLFVTMPQYTYATDKEDKATETKTEDDNSSKKKETSSDSESSSGLGDLDQYKPDGDISVGSLQDKAEGVVGVLSTIGVVVSVVALIALGIKYMLGSVEERAEYKETLKPYIIGAFLVFTVSLIPELIYQFMQNL